MLAEAAADQAAGAAQQQHVTSPPRQEWVAGADAEGEDAWPRSIGSSSSRSDGGGGGRLPQLDGTIDSVDSAFLNMERRSLEGLWR